MENAARTAKKLRGSVGMEKFSPAPPRAQAQTQLTCKPNAYGTLGRAAPACVVMVAVTGFKPSAVAVSLISPASFVACTMICARPLNTLRDHALAAALPTSSTFTSGLRPPWPDSFDTPTAITLSPACSARLMSKAGCADQSADSPTRWLFTKIQP